MTKVLHVFETGMWFVFSHLPKEYTLTAQLDSCKEALCQNFYQESTNNIKMFIFLCLFIIMWVIFICRDSENRFIYNAIGQRNDRHYHVYADAE